MRLGVERNWLYLTRRALVLACMILAVGATSAAAAPRYAVATGGLTSGVCDSTGNACALEYAVETVAQSGETVWLAPGNYNVTSAINGSNVHLRGQAAGVRLVGAAGLGAPTLTVSGSVRELRVESSSGSPALSLDGTGDGRQEQQ